MPSSELIPFALNHGKTDSYGYDPKRIQLRAASMASVRLVQHVGEKVTGWHIHLCEQGYRFVKAVFIYKEVVSCYESKI